MGHLETIFLDGDRYSSLPNIGESQKVRISPDILSNLSNFFTHEKMLRDSLLSVVVLIFSAYFANFVIYWLENDKLVLIEENRATT